MASAPPMIAAQATPESGDSLVEEVGEKAGFGFAIFLPGCLLMPEQGNKKDDRQGYAEKPENQSAPEIHFYLP
jgi:hypothetical protein